MTDTITIDEICKRRPEWKPEDVRHRVEEGVFPKPVAEDTWDREDVARYLMALEWANPETEHHYTIGVGDKEPQE